MGYMREEVQRNTETGERKEFGNRYGRLERTPNLHFPQNIEVYLSNFVGLGLIERTGSGSLPESAEEKDEFLDDRHTIFRELDKERQQDQKPLQNPNSQGLSEERIFLTAYGQMFLDVCLKNIELEV